MKSPFRATLAAALALALAGAVTSCASPSSSSASTDENWITYLEPQMFRTLYPPAAGFYPNGGVVNQVTDRLLYQDPETLQLSPWIATDLPKINADATEYTFNIRTDVTYSDGTPLTAENVVANFDLYGKGDKSRTLNSSEQITNYDHGEVVDDDTVKFYFSAPSPGFAQATAGYNAAARQRGFCPRQRRGRHRLRSLRHHRRDAQHRPRPHRARRLQLGPARRPPPGPRSSRWHPLPPRRGGIHPRRRARLRPSTDRPPGLRTRGKAARGPGHQHHRPRH